MSWEGRRREGGFFPLTEGAGFSSITLIVLFFGMMMMMAMAFAGLLIFAWAVRSYQQRSTSAHPLVVRCGTWNNLPFVGHILNFMPRACLQTLEDFPKLYGGIIEVYLLSKRALLVTDAAMARELMMMHNAKKFRRLRQFDHSSELVGLTGALFFSNGAVWSKVRKATAPSFSNQNIADKFADVALEVQAWIQRLDGQCASGAVDLTAESMSLTLRVITAVAFGLGTGDPIVRYFTTQEVVEDVKSIFRFILNHTAFNRFPAWVCRLTPLAQHTADALAANARFSEHCSAILSQQEQEQAEAEGERKATSMISSMLAGGALGAAEVVANVKMVYMAGSETSAVALCWICYFLCLHPLLVARLREEAAGVLGGPLGLQEVRGGLPLAMAFVKETLRLKPPGVLLNMELEEGIASYDTANGVRIHQGDTVLINLAGMMLSGDAFPDPLAFVPDRWMPGAVGLQKAEEHFVPFGYGPRVCPGATLALAELALATAMLAHTFDMTLACPAGEVKRVIEATATCSKMPIRFARRRRM